MPGKVLLISATTGYQTQMFADAAAGLGIELTLATDRCHVLENPWGDNALPIRFDDPEGSASVLVEQPRFDGIVALGDRPALFAAAVAPRLGIGYNSVEAVAACADKYLARQRFQAAGLRVPWFERVGLQESEFSLARRMEYPCVLKPLHLSASRGVIRADQPDGFVEAFQRIRAIVPHDEFLLVEGFIPGRELALEGLLRQGVLTVLAIFDKPDPLDGPFFEETIYVTPSRETQAIQQSIGATVAQAALALGLTQGPIHVEMRLNSEGVWMLEVAARPIGGLCARVLPGLPERILRAAIGDNVAEPPNGLASGVMMIPIPRAGIFQGVSGLETAKAMDGIEDIVITAKLGQRLIPLPEGSSYLGFIFARGADAECVERYLRDAHAELRFDTTASLTIV